MKKLQKSFIKKIDKRFSIALIILSMIVGGTVYAEFIPVFNQQDQHLPKATSEPTVEVSDSPSPAPSETPTSSPDAVQTPTHASTTTGNNNSAQCQTLVNQANTDLNAQSAAIRTELGTYKAMIANMNSSPAQTIDGSGSTQSQMINQAGQQARLNQESEKIDQMESQFSTAKSNYQNELIGKGCPYFIGAQS